ncbi:hypothetical protein [Nostoc sp. FACHB-110]|nr:hypothetical protein [Nostoc sp. FACHB-110]MBD2439990.1 hypothetical protein [Nostoc sp. FACHB-110]
MPEQICSDRISNHSTSKIAIADIFTFLGHASRCKSGNSPNALAPLAV